MVRAGANQEAAIYGLGAVVALVFATFVAFGVSAAGSPVKAFACDQVRAPTRSLSQSEAGDAMRCLINGARKHHGMKPLNANGDLGDAAQEHTKVMRKHHCFSHQCPGEADPYDRIRSSGYLHGSGNYSFAENIALDTRRSTPRQVFKRWMHSSGHRANILSGTSRDIGIGVSARHKVWWTTDFGSCR